MQTVTRSKQLQVQVPLEACHHHDHAPVSDEVEPRLKVVFASEVQVIKVLEIDFSPVQFKCRLRGPTLPMCMLRR